MGLRTLDQFRDRLSLSLGEHRPPGNERLDDWINDGILEVVSILELPQREDTQTFVTVIDQIPYALAAGTTGVLAVRDTDNDRRLTKISPENFFGLDPASKGRPERYARIGDNLHLWPTVNGTWTIEYLRTADPTLLSAGTDVTDFPASIDRAVQLLAKRNAFEDLGFEDKATRAYQTAVNYLRTLPLPGDLESAALSDGIQIPRTMEELQEYTR